MPINLTGKIIPNRLPLNIQNARRILCVFSPLRIHPRWETFVAGRPIHQCDVASLSLGKKIALWKSYAHYYRSNPRDRAYMTRLAEEFVSRNMPQSGVDVFGDTTETGRIPGPILKDMLARRYDSVLLLYPDAIGYGWGGIERPFLKAGVPLLAINGRQRVFPLNSQYVKKLRWRRWLEFSWGVEILFVGILLPVGLVLAFYDALFHKAAPADAMADS